MTEDTFNTVAEKLCRFAEQKGTRRISFFWQGGEILLLPAKQLENMIQRISNLFDGKNIEITHSLQSNLLAYHSSWKPLIKESFGGSIGSSLDYPNLYRENGAYPADAFNMAWKEKYDIARADGIDVGIISLLNEETLRLDPAEFIDYYAKTVGVKSIQINLPFSLPTVGNNEKSHFLDSDPLGDFLGRLFQTWLSRIIQGDNSFEISTFSNQIKAFTLSSQPHNRSCTWSGNCTEQFFSIGPDGSIGLCDCWVTSLPEYSFGNLCEQDFDAVVSSQSRRQIRQRMEHILKGDCSACKYLSLCFGGCAIRSLCGTGSLQKRDPYCHAYKRLFEEVEKAVYLNPNLFN